MIEVGRLGSLIIFGQEAFGDYCIEHNIQNPYKEELRIWQKYNKWKKDENGKEYMPIILEEDYSEADKKLLKQIREQKIIFDYEENKFVIDYILNHGTYADALEFCEMNDINIDRTILPCEDSTGQCNLYCPIYNKCKYERLCKGE